MRKKDILIITSGPYNLHHGTGVQIRSYFDRIDHRCLHLHFSGHHHGHSDVPWSIHLDPVTRSSHPLGMFRYWVKKLLYRIKRKDIWNARTLPAKLSAPHLKLLLKSRDVQPRVAYICVLSDEDAALASQIPECLQIPYIVHLMDVFETETEDRRGWHSLFKNANHVAGITSQLTEFAKENGAERISTIPIGFATDPLARVRELKEKGIRFFCTGRAAKDAYAVLDEALTGMEGIDSIEYVGPDGKGIPEMRHLVTDHGFLDDQAYAKVIATCDIGIVTLPLNDPSFARFSFPSRLIRMLAAGLPCVVIAHPESAVVEWAKEQSSAAIQCASTPGEILSAIVALSGDLPYRSSEALKVASHFSTAMTVHAISNVFESLTEGEVKLDR